MHGVFTALINGVHEKGEGGVLWVRGEICAYCFPDDFGNAEFASGLKLMLCNPQSQTVFFVVNEADGKLHVVAYPRDKVYAEYHAELTAAEQTAGGTQGKGDHAAEEQEKKDTQQVETASDEDPKAAVAVPPPSSQEQAK